MPVYVNGKMQIEEMVAAIVAYLDENSFINSIPGEAQTKVVGAVWDIGSQRVEILKESAE